MLANILGGYPDAVKNYAYAWGTYVLHGGAILTPWQGRPAGREPC